MIILEVMVTACVCWALVTLVFALGDYDAGNIEFSQVVLRTLGALFFPFTFLADCIFKEGKK